MVPGRALPRCRALTPAPAAHQWDSLRPFLAASPKPVARRRCTRYAIGFQTVGWSARLGAGPATGSLRIPAGSAGTCPTVVGSGLPSRRYQQGIRLPVCDSDRAELDLFHQTFEDPVPVRARVIRVDRRGIPDGCGNDAFGSSDGTHIYRVMLLVCRFDGRRSQPVETDLV